MSHRYEFLVGIDWATQAHQVCVLDADGRLLAERPVAHSGQALAEFADWLLALAGGEPALAAVAIEVPRGAVVDLLVERGFPVYALNPKQLDRFRDRHTVAGAKDDRRDALVLADSLRTDLKSFRRVELDDPRVVEVRELTRIEEELRVEFSRLSHRLREQLHRYYPQLLELVPAADEPWLWALLALAPTPEEGRRLRVRRVEGLLAPAPHPAIKRRGGDRHTEGCAAAGCGRGRRRGQDSRADAHRAVASGSGSAQGVCRPPRRLT
jgi:transposase